MAAYAQFGYGYPSAHQLVSGAVVVQSAEGADISQAAVPTTTTPSPLSGANEASLSPSGGSTATAVATGTVSPGVISQISNNTGTGACGSTVAVVDSGATAANIVDVGAGGAGIAAGKGTSCCENGRPIMTDPVSGHTVCSCQYDSARLAVSGYSRMPSSNVGVYGTPYPSTEQNPYPSIGVDSTAFYSPLGNPYSLKESAAGSDMTAWTSAGLQPTTSYYSYDPTLAAYGYGAGYDLAARRKNATRESTATLKAWLNEHKKNPYPTKGEKIMLAIITKMTLTQVSTWFANARRRLKKENKMTWEPKNKTEDDDAMLSDDEKEAKEAGGSEKPDSIYGKVARTGAADHRKDFHLLKAEMEKDGNADDLTSDGGDHKAENPAPMRSLSAHNASFSHPGYNSFQQQYQQKHNFYHHGGFVGADTSDYSSPKNLLSRDCGIPIPATKPKIWSLADTVACKTPPPTAYLGQQYYSQEQQLPHHPHPGAHPPPPTHPHLHLLPDISSSSSSRGSNTSGQQLLTEQQHSNAQPMNPLAPSSPLSMMNNYVAVSPYSQIPTGYGNKVFPLNCNISNSTGIPTTPTTPHSMNVHQHHYQHQHQQYQAQQQLQRMGFLEIQPDTPPQTPPNMKHSSANAFATNTLPVGPPAHKTGMCYRSAGLPNRPYNGHSPINNLSSNYGPTAASKKEV